MSAPPPKLPMKGLPMANKKAPMPGKAPPGGKLPMAGAKAAPGPGSPPAPGKAPPGAKLPMAGAKGPAVAPPGGAPGSPAAAKKAPALAVKTPPGGKSPSAPALKAPPALKGPPGKSQLGSSPAVPALKAPPGAKTPSGPGLKAPPGGKLPLKLPMKALGGGAAPPPKLGKLPLPKPSAAPIDSLASSHAPDEAGDAPLDTARTDATFVQGDREEPGSPIPTPRDMPGGGGGEGGVVTDTPMASPRIEESAPPPPPPAESSMEPSPPSAPQRPPEGDGDASPPASPLPPPPLQQPLALSPLEPSQPPQPPPLRPEATPMRPDAAWAVHSLAAQATSPSGGQAPSGRIPDYERKLDQAERKLVEAEARFGALTAECNRLRETLYDREGVKVVQHISEIERENRMLRQALQREKDSVLYHQNAHMQCLDELVALRHSINNIGDYSRVKEENERLQAQVGQLVRANTELSLRISDMNEVQSMTNCVVDPLSSPIRDQGMPPYVRVRRGALCAHCKDMVDRWEALLVRRVSQNLLPHAASPVASGSALYYDPLRSPHTPESRIGISAGAGVDHTGARGWRPLQLPNGNVVYHNIITNQSQWEKPAGIP